MWSEKHESLTKLVRKAELEFQSSRERDILDTIRENHESSQAVFSELVTIFEMQASGSGEIARSQELEEGKTAQLLLKSQDIVSAASRLAVTSRKEIATAQKRAGVFVVVFLVIMAVIGIAMLMLFSRKVLKPIIQLQRGAEIIGEGDLDYRTGITSRDEIGGLSRAFDQMTENLKAITASRQELEREVAERRRVEEALRESSQTLEALIQASPLAIIAHDGDAKVRMWNSAAEQTFGWSKEEVLGRPYPFVPEEKQEAFRVNLERSLQGEALTGLETRRHKKDGTQIDVGIWTGPLSDGGAMVVIADITDRKQAEEALRESEEQVRLLLNSTGEAIYGVDLQGNCTFCNPACLRLLGYNEVSDLCGRNMHNLIHHTLPDGQRYPQTECRIYQAMWGESGTHVDDEVLWRADGTSFPAEYWSYPVRRENAQVGCVVTFVDISERKQAEQTLLQQMRELAVLEERSRIAREIHDTLAQGITAIIWQLNAAERVVDSGGEPALKSLGRVRDLARESLQEARRSVWDLQAGPLEGRTLAEALRQETETAAEGREIQASFVVSGDERVLPSGIEAALLRICQESLTNTLKHANATEVAATLTFEGSQVQLVMQDNGDGFDPEAPRTRGQDSGGFGLINMQERVHLLGGELTVQSEPSCGTVVKATLSLK